MYTCNMKNELTKYNLYCNISMEIKFIKFIYKNVYEPTYFSSISYSYKLICVLLQQIQNKIYILHVYNTRFSYVLREFYRLTEIHMTVNPVKNRIV